MSGQFTSLLSERLRALMPAWREACVAVARRAPALPAGRQSKLRSFDGVGALISTADSIEAAFRVVLRWPRSRLSRWGLGLTGALAWRGLAALTGIGLTATLVTALSTDDSEIRLASLTELPAASQRLVRDVRQEPRAVLGDEGWVRIAKPIAMFGLDSAELDRQAPSYEARRSQDGGKREDVLAFGGFTEAKPYLVLRLLLDAKDEQLSQPFVISLVREAAGRGMSLQRSGAPTGIETKFGLVETADATLSDGATSRACIGFRHRMGDAQLSLSGWWCGAEKRPADRQQLVCLLDRVDLLSAGDDRALHAAFARTELKRQPACSPPRLSASGRKTSWLDGDGSAPALRTKSAAAERPRANPRQ
ncbi:hypothetical protein DWF00_02355 [Bosea caraganae]|uniref:Uncharacterized protein n=1 Tax=Bosea caraganae TaxID=2763117 RepID=A0A370L2J6_9HYPH|nr:hypothetical protein [Bosea caraganae]RDJ22444.1 hypothetical protein DWE98_18520 [Bosea caraganae]RDJ30403.1 hypothetical protein DWF00_02355 [Bosea caraganae]